MPTYELTASDGSRYRVTAPEGMSEDAVIAQFRERMNAGRSATTAPPGPPPATAAGTPQAAPAGLAQAGVPEGGFDQAAYLRRQGVDPDAYARLDAQGRTRVLQALGERGRAGGAVDPNRTQLESLQPPAVEQEIGAGENLARSFETTFVNTVLGGLGVVDPYASGFATAARSREIGGFDPYTASGVVGSAAGSLVPAVAAGALVGPTAAAGALGVSSGGASRVDTLRRRLEGQDISSAQEWTAAVGNALAEVVGEKIGLDAILKPRGRGFIKHLLRTVGINAGEETVTQISQNAVQRLTGIEPGKNIFEDVPYAALLGATGGALASPVAPRQTRRPPIERAEATARPRTPGETVSPGAEPVAIPPSRRLTEGPSIEERAEQQIAEVRQQTEQEIAEATARGPSGEVLQGLPSEAGGQVGTAEQVDRRNAELEGLVAPVPQPDPASQQLREPADVDQRRPDPDSVAERQRIDDLIAAGDMETARQEIERLRAEARTDDLTGLGNKRSFREALTGLVERVTRRGKPESFLWFDAANLKAANTALGHEGADRIIQNIATRLREAVGDSAAVVTRPGGDEFAVVLPQGMSQRRARAIRQRIEDAVGRQEIAPGVSMFLSGGVGTIRPGQPVEAALKLADQQAESRKKARKQEQGEVTDRDRAVAAVEQKAKTVDVPGPVLGKQPRYDRPADDPAVAPATTPEPAPEVSPPVPEAPPAPRPPNLQARRASRAQRQKAVAAARRGQRRIAQIRREAQEARAAVTAQQQEALASARRQAVEAPPAEGTAHHRRRVPRTIEELITPLVNRIEDISPRIAGRIWRLEAETGIARERLKKRLSAASQTLVKTLGGRKSEAYKAFVLNANNHASDPGALLESVPASARPAVQEFLDTFRQLFAAARAAGMTIGDLGPGYWPRYVKDYDALLQEFGDLRGEFEYAFELARRALGRPALTADEKAKIANEVIQGYGPRKPGSYGMSNARTRTIAVLDENTAPHYVDPIEAAFRYVDTMTYAVARSRFLGRHVPSDQLADTVGAIVQEEVDRGAIKPEDQEELRQVLQARFTADMLTVPKWVRNIKQLTYMITLGRLRSAVTQLADVAMTFRDYGVRAGTTGVLQSAGLTAREHRLMMEDIGIHDHGEEFKDVSRLAATTDRMLKLSLFTRIDRFGKESRINAAKASLQRRAADPTSEQARETWDRYRAMFGSATVEQMQQDLRNGVDTEDIRMLLLVEVGKVQPVTMSQMPERYLTSPRGRLFYTLKTFMVTQLDRFRRDIVRDLASPQYRSRGVKKLGRFILAHVLLGMPVELFREWLRGRPVPPDELPDTAVDALLNGVGLSRFTLQGFTRDPVQGIKDFLVPPVPFANLVKDTYEGVTGRNAEAPWLPATSGLESIQDIPLIGEMLYYFTPLGEGFTVTRRIAEKRYRDKLSQLREESVRLYRLGDLHGSNLVRNAYNELRTRGSIPDPPAKLGVREVRRRSQVLPEGSE